MGRTTTFIESEFIQTIRKHLNFSKSFAPNHLQTMEIFHNSTSRIAHRRNFNAKAQMKFRCFLILWMLRALWIGILKNFVDENIKSRLIKIIFGYLTRRSYQGLCWRNYKIWWALIDIFLEFYSPPIRNCSLPTKLSKIPLITSVT